MEGLKSRNPLKVRNFKGISASTLQLILLIVALAGLSIAASFIMPGFLTFRHIMTLLYGYTMLGILALAETLIILTGNIDISLGAIYWITIMYGAILMNGKELWIPLLVCISLGALLGLINGFGIAYLRIPSIVMTLAMLIALTGVLYVTTGGGGHGRAAPELISFTTGRIYGIPNIVLVWIILVIILEFMLRRTVLGWKIRTIGSNSTASYLTGINVNRIILLVFSLSGILASIAGLFYLGWARTPYPTFQAGAGVGARITLDAIAATILGGTSFYGGRGSFVRTFLGTLVLAISFSILTMSGLGWTWKMIFSGLIMLTVVGLYSKYKT